MDSGWTHTGSPFHAGEQAAQARMGVRDKIETMGQRMMRSYLPEQHREFYSLLPFLLIGISDEQGRPWASLLVGRPGFVTSPDAYHLKILAQPLFGSPLATQLKVGADIGILGILLENRRRNRATGKIIAIDDEGVTVAISQAFGNCPQYIQTREIEVLPDIAFPQQQKRVIQGDHRLDDKAEALITQSDTFFIATAYSDILHKNEVNTDDSSDLSLGADVSHRGGKPGFVRIDQHQILTFPDFSGNLIYNTIGNILMNPQAGFLFIDFDTRDLLYLTGRAEVIWEGEEVDAFLGAERLIRFHTEEWIRVTSSLPLQFRFNEYSPVLKQTGSWKDAEKTLTEVQQKSTYLPYKIFDVQRESETVSSFYMRRSDDGPIFPHQPGQFLPIRLNIPGQPPVTRVYTLSDGPNGNYYRLSIKKEGLASNFFHDHVAVGSEIEAMRPRGKFVLDQSSLRPVVLLSAGIGITPMLAITQFLIQENDRSIYFIHGARNGQVHAFGKHLRHLAACHEMLTVHIRYSQPNPTDKIGIDHDSKGQIDLNLLKQVLPFNDYDFYLCGPAGFMQSLYDDLTEFGIKSDRIHYESFGPATVLQHTATPPSPKPPGKAVDSPVKVCLAQSEIDIEWSPEQGTLLELAEKAGLQPLFSCRSGMCGVCATKILCGTVDYTEEPTAEFADDEVLICCSTPRCASGEQTCGEAMGVILEL